MQKSYVAVRGLIGVSLGVAVALSAPMAAAKGKADSSAKKGASGKKKLLIGAFSGPNAEQARKDVIAALKDDGEYEISESSSVKPDSDDRAYAKASGGAAAVLVGTVKKGTGLVLSVHNGANGALIQDVDIKGESAAKLRKNIDATLAVSMADAISQAKGGSEDAAPATKSADSESSAEDKDKGKDDEEEKKPEADAATGTGLSPLELTAGLRAVHRSLSYHDTPAQLFPNSGQAEPLAYTLPLGPAVFIDGALYPLAFGSKGIGGNFGIVGGFETNFATKSVYAENTPNQKNLTTRATQSYVGMRGRIPLGVHEFGLLAAYGQQTFNLLGDETDPVVPNVSYRFVRLVADGRLHFDDVTIGFHIGTRLVTDPQGLKSATWFPNTKAQSVEAGLFLGYKLVTSLDLLLGLDVTRYAFNFNPIPTGTPPDRVAGGAVDQYVSGTLGVRYTLPSHATN